MAFIVSALVSLAVISLASAGSWSYQTGTFQSNACNVFNPFGCGPSNWDLISATCDGISQSPINIAGGNVVTDDSFEGPSAFTKNGGCWNWVQSGDYAFVVDLSACSNLYAEYNNKTYWLKHIEFHSPSEHTIGGGHFSAEAQLHHKTSSGDRFVQSVFLQAPPADDALGYPNELAVLPAFSNEFFRPLWDATGNDPNNAAQQYVVANSHTAVSPYDILLPASQVQYHYTGSLTTPNCETGVEWFIYNDPVSISRLDLSYLRKAVATTRASALGNNNRPLQTATPANVVRISGGAAFSASSTDTYTTTTTSSSSSSSEHHMSTEKRAVIVGSVALGFSGIFAILVVAFLVVSALSFNHNFVYSSTNKSVELTQQE